MRWQKRQVDELRAPKKPVVLAGETLRLELATNPAERDRTFRTLRSLLPPGHQGRVTIDAEGVTVDGLKPGDIASLREALDAMGGTITATSPQVEN